MRKPRNPHFIAAAALLFLSAAAPARAQNSIIPDLSRYIGTWLWRKSEGMIATSDPDTRGATRTLVVNPDLTYELHQARAARDSVLCRGTCYFSEETSGGTTTDYLDFGGWFESYEHRMEAELAGPDTLLLAGDPCESCPEHTYVRGWSAMFEDSVKAGETYRHPLGHGLSFELVPVERGWRVAVRDTARTGVDLASLAPAEVTASQEVTRFIFSPERPGKRAGEITSEEVERARDRGRGVLAVESWGRWMRFRAEIEESGIGRAPSRRP